MACSNNIQTDKSGVGAVEFALTFPIFLLALLGTLELGAFFFSSAGLRHAVNEAARYATIYPTPNEQQLRVRMNDQAFGLAPARITASFMRGEDVNKGAFITISASYDHQYLSSFFGLGSVSLAETRKVWLHAAF